MTAAADNFSLFVFRFVFFAGERGRVSAVRGWARRAARWATRRRYGVSKTAGVGVFLSVAACQRLVSCSSMSHSDGSRTIATFHSITGRRFRFKACYCVEAIGHEPAFFTITIAAINPGGICTTGTCD